MVALTGDDVVLYFLWTSGLAAPQAISDVQYSDKDGICGVIKIGILLLGCVDKSSDQLAWPGLA